MNARWRAALRDDCSRDKKDHLLPLFDDPHPPRSSPRAPIVPFDTGVPGGAVGIHMGGVPPMALVVGRRAGPSDGDPPKFLSGKKRRRGQSGNTCTSRLSDRPPPLARPFATGAAKRHITVLAAVDTLSDECGQRIRKNWRLLAGFRAPSVGIACTVADSVAPGQRRPMPEAASLGLHSCQLALHVPVLRT